ncbi:MAG: tetratricopeptide repeat protein [Saprospiraceae bacterium]|nr:tetratricopeptide repeat protein [Saprospiraceae bacterium]
MRAIIIISAVLFTIIKLTAQENAWSIDRLQKYKLGQDMFENKLYGPAGNFLKEYIHMAHPATHDDFINLQNEAQAITAISSLRLDLTSGENELLSFINRYYPDPITTPAILELGSYYYNQKWFKKSSDMYARTDLDNLAEFDMSEASFKKGYAHFVMKEFKEGKIAFSRTKEIKNIYYYPSNYYFGICDYFMGNYADAVSSFQKVTASDVYKSFVPYYIAQIHFAQDQPEKVISYAEQSLKDPNLRNRKEIRLLLGQSYFKRREFEKALPHLEFYESNTEKLSIEEFYQLGFTQYQLKKYEAAIKNFKELNLLDSKLGQLVNYYLADCYYRTNDLVSARAAFRKVSMMPYEMSMKEEATFNYGKLSAEAGFEREAVNTLIKLDSKSPYHKQASDIINDLLENTGDFASAITIIEGLPSLTERLKATYQNVCLKFGMQQYNSGETDKAKSSFEKSQKYKIDKNTYTQAAFWIAQILNEKKEFKKSIEAFEAYFELSNGLEKLPEESSPNIGHYTQGYNYLETKDYKNAEKSFKNAIVGFNLNRENLKNDEIINKILPDALIRTGDCLFRSRSFQDAMVFYEQAIAKKQGGFIYAMYQKAIIEGLLGEPYEKILSLKDIKTDYPTSEYADDALLQLGDTYFELENVDNAYASFSELASQYPNSPLKNAAYLKLGLIAYNKGDMTTAILHYKQIFQNNPSSKEAESALLGLQEIYINDLGQSEEYVNFVSSMPGYEVSSLFADSLSFKVGESRYNEGEYEKAITGLNNYLDKYPNGSHRIQAYYLRAESASILKKYGAALDDYEKLIKLGVSDYYQLSLKKAALISYNYTQAFEKANKYYDQYYTNVADISEKYQAALGALRSGFRISDFVSVKKYANIITNHAQANQEDKAVASYYLGKLYYKNNELDLAKTSLEKASNNVNNNQAAEARYLIADIFFKQNKLPQAEAQCNIANEKNTLYPFWIAKSLILMSDIYILNKDLFNARAAIEAVLENFSDDTDLISIATAKLKTIEILEQQNNRIKPISKNMLELDTTNKK